MHRNAEIWEKRHARLEAIHDRRMADFVAAVDVAVGQDRHRIARAKREWFERWAQTEKRVWHALCAAKGWRKW